MDIEEITPESCKVISPGEDDIFYYYAKTDEDRKKVDTILADYPVRITPYLKEVMKTSEAVRRQFLPHPEELDTKGTPTPFEEGKHAGSVYGLEQVYRDRVLLTPHFDCPAYCRFCYKKSRVLRGQKPMTFKEIDTALEEVGKLKTVRGVLITGGDPLMNPKKLFYMMDRAMEQENVHEIRVGSRRLTNSPEIFSDALCDKLASYIKPNYEDPEKSKYVALNVHFNHPDELTPQALEACHKLTSRGITLRNQCVLLKGINDNKETVGKLFALLLRNNMVCRNQNEYRVLEIPYYFNHCMPVEGADHLRCSVARGQEIYRHLCTESSCAIPNYVFAVEAGKYHIGANEEFDYKEIDGQRFIKVTLPYKYEEFHRITGHELPPRHSVNEDGYIVGHYMDGYDD